MDKQPTIGEKLKAIRDLVEVDLSEEHIDVLEAHGKRLAAIVGLSAETMAHSKKLYQASLLKAINGLKDSGLSPSVMMKTAQAQCGEDEAVMDYADRLNAGITHQLDFYRTVISKYKAELENSLK
jgi:hypothetical protein